MSGGEPSSIKQFTRCAVRSPALSRSYGYRVAARFDLVVYGLTLQFILFYCVLGGVYMHQALYRKWRPQIFDDVYGQEHITSILKYETQNNRFSHAYLFCGSRGTGKTTCAKILSKAVNCEAPVEGNPCNCCAACRSIDMGTATDVLEMDAASNNGVDNIRDIRDEIVYTPSDLKYRVYIVDEVHMLSTSAFNALLKTLEEPPAHAIFVLATTELHKLPATIVSRCQRYDFRRITTDTIIERLALIADSEKFEYTREALRIIAKMAQGGMRDAISLLELCAGTRQKITVELVNDTLGVGGRDNAERIVRAISACDFDTVFAVIEEVVSSSKDIAVFWQDIISFYRDMLVVKTTLAAKRYLDLTDDEYEKLSNVVSLFTKETLLHHCRILDETSFVMQKAGAYKRTVAEMALIRMCDNSLDDNTDAILSRISKLENAIAIGTFSVQSSANAECRESNVKNENVSCDTQPSELTFNQETAHDAQQSLKSLRGWNEIVEQAAAGDDSVLGFLKTAKAFIDSQGAIYIRFPNKFAMDMALAKKTLKNDLRAALCILLKRQIADENIYYGIFEGNESELEELDELNI